MCWCTDLLFKKKYRSVTKNQCPGILTYYSKTRKSMKMSTLARKNEQLFFRKLSIGCFSIYQCRCLLARVNSFILFSGLWEATFEWSYFRYEHGLILPDSEYIMLHYSMPLYVNPRTLNLIESLIKV